MDLCRRLIQEADLCADAPDGIAIGERFEPYVIIPGALPGTLPEALICVRHEHGGKVIIAQDAKIKAN